MYRLFLAFCLAVTVPSAAIGEALPLTLKEVTLMLRTGYSSEAVKHELSVRRLAEAYDGAVEASLRAAGATPALVDALRKGTYQLPQDEARAALRRLAEQAEKRAIDAERAQELNALYADQLARQRSSAVSTRQTPSIIADLCKGDLVSYKDGTLVRYDDAALAGKKLFALYFSAHWCGPCRKFTPRLVEFYNQYAQQHPEFEVIFMSDDRSAFGMESYVREAGMPWPAIEFAKLPAKETLKKYAGSGIPCLVVVDAGGKVIFDTYAGQTFVGPDNVLANLVAIFTNSSGGMIATDR